ncbi:hypothetical protein HYW46_07135 [Candidatus Daviesbacteria bacterium]|nr:hypothetical protein [Candidatus Daviesbacteria bacterium]
MKDLRKTILAVILILLGILLALAGLSLIQISQGLLLYSGIGLLALAIIFYIIF